jgi:hypothetical protein
MDKFNKGKMLKKGFINNKMFRYSAGIELAMPSLEERLKVSTSIFPIGCFVLDFGC